MLAQTQALVSKTGALTLHQALKGVFLLALV
jgi:hypothetical protein